MSSYMTSPFVLEERRLQGIADQCCRDLERALKEVEEQERRMEKLAERQEEEDRDYYLEIERALLLRDEKLAHQTKENKKKRERLEEKLKGINAELRIYEKRYGGMEAAADRQRRLWLQLRNTAGDFGEVERHIEEQEKEIEKEVREISERRAGKRMQSLYLEKDADVRGMKGISLQMENKEKTGGYMQASLAEVFGENLRYALALPCAEKYPSLALLRDRYEREPDYAKAAFAVKNKGRLKALTEQIERLALREQEDQEKRLEIKRRYGVLCGLMGIEPDGKLMADSDAGRALAERYHELYHKYTEKKRQQYVEASISAVMEKHGIYYQSGAEDESGGIRFEMEDALLEVSGTDSGHLRMEVAGEYAGDAPTLNEKRKALTSAEHFCLLFTEIEEELARDYGIRFSRVMTKEPEEETILMKKKGASAGGRKQDRKERHIEGRI